MKYNSVDEIDTISFRDAAIVRCVFSAKQGILEFELDGAMVRENNWQMNCSVTDMSEICR